MRSSENPPSPRGHKACLGLCPNRRLIRDSGMMRNDLLDGLREIINIGAGHAASALSTLLDRKGPYSCPPALARHARRGRQGF